MLCLLACFFCALGNMAKLRDVLVKTKPERKRKKAGRRKPKISFINIKIYAYQVMRGQRMRGWGRMKHNNKYHEKSTSAINEQRRNYFIKAERE